MTRRSGRTVFVFAVGLIVVLFSYRWITDPEPRAARAREEQVVLVARTRLQEVVQEQTLEIVDALAPQRKVGKVYIYPEQEGWAVSGYYRRNESDPWHAYLMTLSADLKLLSLKLDDKALQQRTVDDPELGIAQ